MNQTHVSHLIDDYIDGLLTPEDRKIVEFHIQECAQCRNELAEVNSVVNDLQRLPKSIAPPKKLALAANEKAIMGFNKPGMLFLRSLSGWRMAAAIGITIGSGVLIWYSLRDESATHGLTERRVETISPEVERQLELSKRTLPMQKLDKKDSPQNGKTGVQLKSLAETQGAQKETVNEKTVGISPAEQKKQKTVSGFVEADSSLQMTKKTQIQRLVEIRGTVADSLSGQPLIGANVIIVGTNLGSATDINGNYHITNVSTGRYAVIVRYIGYEPKTIDSVFVRGDSLLSLNFRLQPTKLLAQEVVVLGQRPLIWRSATSTVRINGAGLQAQSKTSSGMVSFSQFETPYERRKGFNTEEYNKIDENEFKDALTNPLSTFSIDVDAASYSNVRRFIKTGQLPPKDAVRIEEMINYFKYDYPEPTGDHPFSISKELSVCPWNGEHSLLLIGLQGKNLPAEKLPPSNLVFLIDVSGSMDQPNKLPLVKAAFRLLVQQLRRADRVAIVVYAGAAGLVLRSTPGDKKEEISSAIEELEAGGSTAGGAGIKLAYQIARENFLKNGNNRVILATDGDFNVGVSSEGDLVRLIEDERRHGIYLSVLGFGMGNYKDSKMEKLADRGNGNYAYIDEIQEARKVLVGQMAGTLYTIAKDVKIQIEFNPAIVKSYRLVGYENRLLNKEDFKDDKKDAGELGVGHSVTALYEVVLKSDNSRIESSDSLKYQTSEIRPEAFRGEEALTLKLRYKPPTDTVSKLIVTTVTRSVISFERTSQNLQFASAVAMFGMILRDSKFKQNLNYDQVIGIAKSSLGSDPHSYRSQFVQLVETVKLLDSRSSR